MVGHYNFNQESLVSVCLPKWGVYDYNSYHPHSALGYLPPALFWEKQSVT